MVAKVNNATLAQGLNGDGANGGCILLQEGWGTPSTIVNAMHALIHSVERTLNRPATATQSKSTKPFWHKILIGFGANGGCILLPEWWGTPNTIVNAMHALIHSVERTLKIPASATQSN
jgi:hypothetical protein